MLAAFNTDLAAVTETWLRKAHSDFSFDINGYVMFRLDRVGRKRGGICVYVRNCMRAAVLRTAKHECGLPKKHELMWLSFVESSMKFIRGVLYQPPRAKYNINELIDRLHNDIEELVLLHSGSLLLLVGDFSRLNLDKFLANNGIIQIVTGSTRGSQTFDRCYTNQPDIF
jgi:hypothetical protein